MHRDPTNGAPGLRVCLDVDDVARATAFYVAAFGFTPGLRGKGWQILEGGPAPLDLLEKPAGGLRTYARHWTPVHLDVVVPDLDAALARAIAAGAKQEGPIRVEPYGRYVGLADPFGHGVDLLELNERGYAAIAEP